MGKTAEREVLAVIDDYMKGSYRADGVLLKSVFHQKAVMNGFLGAALIMGGPSPFIEDITSAPSMESNNDDYILSVDQVFIKGDIASAIVTETGFRGKHKLVDCFHLIKVDGLWSIVSKLFTTC